MPELLISSSTTASAAPPPAAFQPALRILKRPTPSVPVPSTVAPDSQQKSYAEREAQYQAARQRIFGVDSTSPPVNPADSEPSPKSALPMSDSNTQGPRSSIIRNPKGPDISGGASKGFNRPKGNVSNPPN